MRRRAPIEGERAETGHQAGNDNRRDAAVALAAARAERKAEHPHAAAEQHHAAGGTRRQAHDRDEVEVRPTADRDRRDVGQQRADQDRDRAASIELSKRIVEAAGRSGAGCGGALPAAALRDDPTRPPQRGDAHRRREREHPSPRVATRYHRHREQAQPAPETYPEPAPALPARTLLDRELLGQDHDAAGDRRADEGVERDLAQRERRDVGRERSGERADRRAGHAHQQHPAASQPIDHPRESERADCRERNPREQARDSGLAKMKALRDPGSSGAVDRHREAFEAQHGRDREGEPAILPARAPHRGPRAAAATSSAERESGRAIEAIGAPCASVDSSGGAGVAG